MLVSYKICQSCWSSRLCWRRAIQLVPFSQSPQYISAPQHGDHHMEVYGRDVTMQCTIIHENYGCGNYICEPYLISGTSYSSGTLMCFSLLSFLSVVLCTCSALSDKSTTHSSKDMPKKDHHLPVTGTLGLQLNTYK